MTHTLSAFFYLIASLCFIMSLRGLSSPDTARGGNWYGITGMAIAIVTTLLMMLFSTLKRSLVVF